MGWSSDQNWTRKVEVLRDIKRDYKEQAKEFKVGTNGLWVLTKNGDIHFVLIEKRDGCWCEKSLSADCGPFYFDVPAGWLKDWEPKTEYGSKWLDGVREYQREKKKDLVGATVVYQNTLWKVEAHPGVGGKYKLIGAGVASDVTKAAIRKNAKVFP